MLQVPSDESEQQSHVAFIDTTVFTRPGCSAQKVSLPSSAEVLAQHKRSSPRSLRVAAFEEFGLVVKFRWPPRVRLDDALTMRALREAFPKGEVPIPEVFGWRLEDGMNFIYRSLVIGVMLCDMWPGLSESHKITICKILGLIQTHLRQLGPEIGEAFFGTSSCVVAARHMSGHHSITPHLQDYLLSVLDSRSPGNPMVFTGVIDWEEAG